jgi:hypothetical protein
MGIMRQKSHAGLHRMAKTSDRDINPDVEVKSNAKETSEREF